MLTWENHRPSVDLRKGLGGDGRAICADGGADGHEKAFVRSALSFLFMHSEDSYPKVAAEPAMY